MRSLRTIARVAVGVSLTTALGCAGTSVTTLPVGTQHDAKENTKEDGIRYYEEAPFILVYTDSKGGLQTQLLFLPDTTRINVIDAYSWMASNKLELTFSHGVLTASTQTIDTTSVPKAVIEAAKTALIAGLDKPKQDNDEIPPPALYRLWIDKQGNAELIGGYGTDIGGQARENIHVKVSQPSETKKPAEGESAKAQPPSPPANPGKEQERAP